MWTKVPTKETSMPTEVETEVTSFSCQYRDLMSHDCHETKGISFYLSAITESNPKISQFTPALMKCGIIAVNTQSGVLYFTLVPRVFDGGNFINMALRSLYKGLCDPLIYRLNPLS